MLKNQCLKYVLIGFIWTVIVDWGTAGGFHLAYWNTPLAGYIMRGVIFLFIPLFPSYFIFRRDWNGVKLLLPTIIVAFIVEVLIVKNPLTYTFPSLLWGIPFAVAIYSAIIYLPLWLINGEIKENKRKAIFLVLITVFICVVSFFTQK